MRDNINQHFVPQYYIRNFSLNNSINILDIKNLKTFKNSPNNTGYKKYFYDIDPQLAAKFIKDDSLSVKFVDDSIRIYNENLLSSFINSFNLYPEMIEQADVLPNISVIDKYSLIDFALIQLYRTPKNLKLGDLVMNHLGKRSKLKFTDVKKDKLIKTVNGILLLSVLSICNYKIKIEFKDWIKKILANHQNKIELLNKEIFSSLTVLYLNKTKKLFITSDSPVGIKWNFNNKIPRFEVITIPINPRVAFLLINKNIFPQYQNSNARIRIIQDNEIGKLENINLFTTSCAHRFLYNQSKDFAKEISFIKGEVKCRIEY